MIDPGLLAELDALCVARSLCWTVGRTRLGARCCRAFPLDPTRREPVVTEDSPTFDESIRRAIARLDPKD